MLISHRYKFVFLAYARTAGSSIRQVLTPFSDIGGDQRNRATPEIHFSLHMNARSARHEFQHLGWRWEDYQSFCLVRNPYLRLASLFARRIDAVHLNDPEITGSARALNRILARLPTKPAFLVYVLTRNPRRGLAQDLPAFTEDSDGKMLVSSVIKFEEFEIELPKYLKTIGVNIEGRFPRVNQSQRPLDLQSIYIPMTARLVRRKYGGTIAKFGYEAFK